MSVAWFVGGVNSSFEIAIGWQTGHLHGIAMVVNAATFHLITPLDSYVDGVIEDNGGMYGTANVFAHIGAWAAELAGGMYVASLLPQFTVIVGKGSPFHVVYQAGLNSPFLHAVGGQFGRMRVVTMAADRVLEFNASRYAVFRLPILFPGAAGGLAGERAFSCLTNAVHAFGRGWIPFL